MSKRVKAILGDALCFFLAVPATVLGWLPHFAGMNYGWFLIGTAACGLAFGWYMTRQNSGEHLPDAKLDDTDHAGGFGVPEVQDTSGASTKGGVENGRSRRQEIGSRQGIANSLLVIDPP